LPFAQRVRTVDDFLATAADARRPAAVGQTLKSPPCSANCVIATLAAVCVIENAPLSRAIVSA
jgi:hypothetical protein